MSRLSNTEAHKGKTQRARRGYPPFHGKVGTNNRKRTAKLERRLRDFSVMTSESRSDGWSGFKRPGSFN